MTPDATGAEIQAAWEASEGWLTVTAARAEPSPEQQRLLGELAPWDHWLASWVEIGCGGWPS